MTTLTQGTRPLRVHIMTAGLTPRDAVSHYAFNLARLFRQWGARLKA